MIRDANTRYGLRQRARWGRSAVLCSTVEFVIVKDGHAWRSPRGTAGQWNINRWTRDPEDAYLYPSWQAADAAIKRHIKAGHIEFKSAKYCDYSEFCQMVKDGVWE